jgi:hypothetical protein
MTRLSEYLPKSKAKWKQDALKCLAILRTAIDKQPADDDTETQSNTGESENAVFDKVLAMGESAGSSNPVETSSNSEHSQGQTTTSITMEIQAALREFAQTFLPKVEDTVRTVLSGSLHQADTTSRVEGTNKPSETLATHGSESYATMVKRRPAEQQSQLEVLVDLTKSERKGAAIIANLSTSELKRRVDQAFADSGTGELRAVQARGVRAAKVVRQVGEKR